MEVDIEDYSVVKECEYKGERYSVRDNGAVLRHTPEGKKTRPLDDNWTFGTKKENGYMQIGSSRVHIIVATAFHGPKDSKVYVVDHIDTNRCNNRPENLRWLTKLENALLNPVTCKRLTILCGGDIMKFIKNPSSIEFGETYQDLKWMRTVTAEEANNAYNNVKKWAQRPSAPKPATSNPNPEWMFEPYKTAYNPVEDKPAFVKALAPETALQKDWRTPSTFPCCPSDINTATLQEYFDNLAEGALFAENDHGKQTVVAFALADNDACIAVVTHSAGNSVKPYGLVFISESGRQFIHENRGTFFQLDGAMKYFTIAQGLPWEGGETFDDYCD